MAKTIERLTDGKVAKLVKAGEPGRTADGLGLYLQVLSPRNSSWLLRYTHPVAPLVKDKKGKKRRKRRPEKWMGLGPAHTVTLDMARAKAQEARQLIDEYIDPLEHGRAERDRKEREYRDNILFKDAAEQFLALHEPTWRNPKHRQRWRNTLKDYAYGKLGTRPVKVIDAALINEIVQPIWTEGKEVTAGRVRQRIDRIVAWVEAGKPLPMVNGQGEGKHHPALPWQEIPQFMAELRGHDSVSARALEFLILTATRTGAVIKARRAEIDRKAKVWTFTGDDDGRKMRAGREHRVPLSPRALEILDDLPKEKGNDHLFIGGKAGQGLSNMALAELIKGMHAAEVKAGRKGWIDPKQNDRIVTPHGTARSSFKDWCREATSYPDIVSEKALGHTDKDKVRAAYARSDLLEKRRTMMHKWSTYCASRPGGGNVVLFNQAKAA